MRSAKGAISRVYGSFFDSTTFVRWLQAKRYRKFFGPFLSVLKFDFYRGAIGVQEAINCAALSLTCGAGQTPLNNFENLTCHFAIRLVFNFKLLLQNFIAFEACGHSDNDGIEQN